MYNLVLLLSAKKDILEAAQWYNKRQKGLGKRFTTEVRRKLNLLKQNPYIFANRYDEVRTAVLDIFPFMAHYTVNESQKIVIISAILHTSRNPDIWKTLDDDFNDVD